MEENNLGTENLRIAISAGINLGIRIEKNLQDDGKISLGEAIAIGGASFGDVVKVIQKGVKIKDEFLDLTEDERNELVILIKNDLDLQDDKVENIIEKALDFLVALDNLVKSF
jgi:DNA primase large subunit